MKNRKRDIQCGAHYHGSKASYMKCYRARYKPHQATASAKFQNNEIFEAKQVSQNVNSVNRKNKRSLSLISECQNQMDQQVSQQISRHHQSNQNLNDSCMFILNGPNIERYQFEQSVRIDYRACKFLPLSNKLKQANTIPQFNFDKKYFTPSFKVQFDSMDDKVRNWKKEFEDNYWHALNYLDQVSYQILVPKPRHHTCQICSKQFEDYKDHIEQNQHRKKLKQISLEQIVEQLKKLL